MHYKLVDFSMSCVSPVNVNLIWTLLDLRLFHFSTESQESSVLVVAVCLAYCAPSFTARHMLFVRSQAFTVP